MMALKIVARHIIDRTYSESKKQMDCLKAQGFGHADDCSNGMELFPADGEASSVVNTEQKNAYINSKTE